MLLKPPPKKRDFTWKWLGSVAFTVLLIWMQTQTGTGKRELCYDIQKKGKEIFAVLGNQNDIMTREVDMLLNLQPERVHLCLTASASLVIYFL